MSDKLLSTIQEDDVLYFIVDMFLENNESREFDEEEVFNFLQEYWVVEAIDEWLRMFLQSKKTNETEQ